MLCLLQTIADIIRTCLGPQAMLKMLMDPMGGIVMTNDGNAILREITVQHPAAKFMIEIARTQDEEVMILRFFSCVLLMKYNFSDLMMMCKYLVIKYLSIGSPCQLNNLIINLYIINFLCLQFIL